MKDDQVVFEQQYRGNVPTSRTISWSVGKSFVSALIGIALHDGHIESVAEPITKVVPELAWSAYDGVRIKDVLQMSSGASWSEDYSDSNSSASAHPAASTVTTVRTPRPSAWSQTRTG